MDDSLDGMPDFGKPEEIPLVVPDLPPPRAGKKCAATTKAGNPCTTPAHDGTPFCIAHDPAITSEVRSQWQSKGGASHNGWKLDRRHKPFTKREILQIITSRLTRFMEKFGEVDTIEATEIFCELCRTWAAVAKVDLSKDEEAKVHGWRMKGAV